MGRLVNVIGVRSEQNSEWHSKGNWGGKDTLRQVVDVNFIYSFFSSNKIKSLGFLLNHAKLEEKNNKLNYKIGLHAVKPKELFSKNIIPRNLGKKNNFFRLMILELLLLKAFDKLNMKKICFQFEFVPAEAISAFLISDYVKTKLKQKFTLGAITFPLSRFLSEKKNILGFRIDCNGRFSRRQRTSYFSLKTGSVPFSKRSVFIDYEKTSVILKFGKCGIKVWVSKLPNICVKEKKFFLVFKNHEANTT